MKQVNEGQRQVELKIRTAMKAEIIGIQCRQGQGRNGMKIEHRKKWNVKTKPSRVKDN